MLINDATFVVVDTETTGLRAANDRVIELAAVKMQHGRVVDRFDRLVNPGQIIPRHIARLTGISNGMVRDCEAVSEVLPAFLAFLDEAIFVAHNLSFDRGFLNAEMQRAGLGRLGNPMLCTLRLARRLLQGLPSKSLASLSRYFNMASSDAHRALPDAMVTQKILLRFLDDLAIDHEVTTVDELLKFQFRIYKSIRPQAGHIAGIREAILPGLPDAPGVYFMKNGKGNTIYIGKAISLRNRVSSYFSGLEGQSPRMRHCIGAVRSVEWTVTDSELEALLLESRLIKEECPRFNRAERRYTSRPFLRLSTDTAHPHISVSAFVHNDGAEYYGPFTDRAQADFMANVLYACFGRAPLVDAARTASRGASGDRSGGVLTPDGAQKARGALAGADRELLDLVEENMHRAAAQFAFEEAARYRDWLRHLGWIYERREGLAMPLFDRNVALILNGDSGEPVQVILVRAGRHAATLRLTTPLPRGAEQRLRECVAVYSEFTTQQRYLEREIDEVRIVAQWMHQRREQLTVVPWEPGTDAEVFVAGILRHVTHA